MTEFDHDKQGNPIICRDGCGSHLKMVQLDNGKWAPRNLDGSKHACPKKPVGKAQSVLPKPPVHEEHAEYEKKEPGHLVSEAEEQVRVIIREELAKFLQWMASQAEGQA